MRILPALPATPPPALGSGIAGTGSPTLGRVVDARIVAPVAGDLYQAVAGQLQLQVRSTVPLLAGQPVRLHLHGQGQATLVPDEAAPDIPPGMTGTPAVQTSLSARGQLLANAALTLARAPNPNPNPNPTLQPALPTAHPPAALTAGAGTAATAAALTQAGGSGVSPGRDTAAPGQHLQASSGTAARPIAPGTPGHAPATRLYQELSAGQHLTGTGSHPAARMAPAVAMAEPGGLRNTRPASETQPTPASTKASATQLASPGDVASQARVQLHSVLPRQHDPARLVSLLQALTPALQDTQRATSPLLQAARQLLNSLPTSSQMQTSAGVLGSLQRSGLLAPDRDTPVAGNGSPDLKQALAALADIAPTLPVEANGQRSAPAGQLQPLATPALAAPADETALQTLLMQLAAEAEPVHARIESHQLMHLQQQDGNQPQWLFELPLRHGQQIDLWQCQIQRDAPRPGQQEQAPGWQLTLAVDMAAQGPLMIRLGMQGEQLWIHFHADSAATRQQIESHLGELMTALRDKGVVPAQLFCHQGLPHPDALPDPPHHVLETTA